MLRLDDLSCGYGPFRAVHDLKLVVEEGGVYALVGANGAGKSSTLMAIAGHVQIQSGRIQLDGRDIITMPVRDRVRAGIAVAPEGRKLFPDLTVEENLIVGGYTRTRAESQNSKTRVYELFPRIADRRKQAAGSLSGGEQQMVAIGRALMAAPKLLLIDEVSLGLMPKMVDICYQAIARLKAEGMTVLLVEQSTKRALEISDHVCVLESGRAVWQGEAEEARNDPGLIEAYLGMSEESA